MGTKTKTVKKVLLTVLCIILLIAAVIAVLLGVKIHGMNHLTLYGFTAQRADGTYYADAEGVHSPLLVSSDVDLSPYLTGAGSVLTVSGEVTKLRTGHQDVMGIYLPCLTFDYRIRSVLSAENPESPAREE